MTHAFWSDGHAAKTAHCIPMPDSAIRMEVSNSFGGARKLTPLMGEKSYEW